MKITSLKSLKMETERIRFKVRMDKEKIVTELKLLRYHLIEQIMKEVAGLFKSDTGKEDSRKQAKSDTV